MFEVLFLFEKLWIDGIVVVFVVDAILRISVRNRILLLVLKRSGRL